MYKVQVTCETGAMDGVYSTLSARRAEVLSQVRGRWLI